ncbi:hypothetical protein ACFSQ7_45005 [Paenibacillus rhizoplanae]
MEGQEAEKREKNNGVKLLFSFTDAAECSAFKPERIGVESASGVTDYEVKATVNSCQVAAGAGVDGDAKGETGAGVDGDAKGETGAGVDGGAKSEAGAGVDGAAKGEAGAGVDGDAKGETGAGVDGDASGEVGAGADGGADSGATASPAAAGTPPSRVYEVTVELSAGAKLAAGDMITAGRYSLQLAADPGSAPEATATAAPSTEPSASASPEADAE